MGTKENPMNNFTWNFSTFEFFYAKTFSLTELETVTYMYSIKVMLLNSWRENQNKSWFCKNFDTL